MSSSTNNITSNNKSEYFQTAGQQEAERLDRMTNEQYRRGNAKLVSEMLRSYSFPSTKCSSKGSKLHLKYISEQTRNSLLSDPDQLRASKALAMEVALLIKKSGYQTLSPYYQGMKRNTKALEEAERQRRLSDVEECRARKMNALKVSDAIRVDASTIKARFIRRGPSIKAWRKDIVHATDNVLPTAMKQAFSSFFQKASSIKDNIVHSVQNAIKGESVSLQAIKLLEEGERQRRMAEDKNGSAVGNAKKVSQLLHIAKFPKLSHNTGFNLHFAGIEERERTRRLSNKFECESKRMMAGELSSLINQLGWPFISSAKNVKFCTPGSLLSEAERARRLDDKQEMIAARIHAHKISKLVGAAIFPKNKSFALSYTRGMEEKERAYRIKNGTQYAVHNAHREAQQIADIGGIFFVPTQHRAMGREVTNLKVTKPKEGEKWGAEQIEGQKIAKKIAQMVQNKQDDQLASKKLIKAMVEQVEQFDHSFDSKFLEEMERKYRLCNKDLEHQAKVNANNVARLIKKQSPYTPNKSAAPLQLKSATMAKKPEFSLWAKKLDLPQPFTASSRLIETVQRLYDMEVKMAEREEKKVQSVAKGTFGTFRSNSHAAAAKKHNDNAKQHLQWLQEARRNAAPATSSQTKATEPSQPTTPKAATAAY